jgi:hypothetical protein
MTGDVAISRRAVERRPGVGDNDRPRKREADGDDDETPRKRSLSNFCNVSVSFLYISRSSSTFFK